MFLPVQIFGLGFGFFGLIFPEEVGMSRLEIIKWFFLVIPSLLITRKYDLTVDFKLQVRGNPRFIDLLK